MTNLVRVKDEMQLADVVEGTIEGLDKHLNQVEDAELGLGAVDHKHNVQSGVMTIDDARVLAPNGALTLQKVAHVVRALGQHGE